MSEEIVVGGFRLIEPVGRGGMGVVWSAEHVRQKVPAALKFITGRRGRDEVYRRQFRNEVESMAALHHPGVATIFDYGETSGLEDYGIAPRTPYLALEWASGGTLSDVVPVSDWLVVRDYLLEILDALSHAHARNVFHRDLKPQNVLVGADGRLKLTDFGLAYQRRGASELDAQGGSPRWMAPEQIRGKARDQGAWTDLYGVGCLVFWMLTYRPPYHQGTVDEILRAHAEAPIPRLRSRIAVPPDIETWLRRMLAKNPNDRYRYAADAAHDLRQFPDHFSLAFDDAAEEAPPAEELDDTELFGEEPVGLDEPSSYASYERSEAPVRLERRPPMASSWSTSHPAPPMNLVGAGLNLWGLRAIPLVDRKSEQQALWDALREVQRRGEMGVIVLSGAAGTGKSRLARWLGGRAQELGAAHVAWSSHEPLGDASDGLAGAVSHWFRSYGLGAEDALARVAAEFSVLRHSDEHHDAEALSALIASTSAETRGGATADARERWRAAWLRYLEPATRDRPMVMVFDDVQWGAETLAFVARALQTDAELPLLFVLTVRDEALSERPVERVRLAALLDDDRTSQIEVRPLDAAKRNELVRRMLRLDPVLAAEVAERSGGNPLFAVQLTDDWVQRGLLRVDDNGFVLADSAAASLPDELRIVWASRLDRFLKLRKKPKAARHAIELAAALGHVVSNAEWRDVCHRAGVEASPSLVDSLVRDGLALRRDTGWAFCHGMFREAIDATALAEGRGERWHSACADHIEARFGHSAETAERHAGHLIVAGRFKDALPRLLAAAEMYGRTGEFDRLDGIFVEYDQVLELAGGDVSVDRMRGGLHRVRNDLFRASVDELEPLLADTEAEIIASGDPLLRAEALFVRSRLERHRGRTEEALAAAEEALRYFVTTDHATHLALLYRALGELYRALGRLTESGSCYEAAAERFVALGDEFQVGWCELGLAATAKQQGRDDAHVQHFEAAARAFANAQSYGALGCAYNEKGEWLRAHGHIADARSVYLDSLAILPSNHSEVGVSQFNLALTFIAEAEHDEARAWLARAAESFERLGRRGSLIYVDLALIVCASGEADWDEVDALTERIEPEIESRRASNQDVASLLMQAGDLCAGHGAMERAMGFWGFSKVHWQRLRRIEELKEIDQRLSGDR